MPLLVQDGETKSAIQILLEGENNISFRLHYSSPKVSREFLDASTHLYKRVCPSVGPTVRRSVGPSVGQTLL